jgi:hypothetical protein
MIKGFINLASFGSGKRTNSNFKLDNFWKNLGMILTQVYETLNHDKLIMTRLSALVILIHMFFFVHVTTFENYCHV